MSTRVKKYLPTLKRIRRLGEKARRDYVRKCDNEFIHCISECAKNVIKGNLPLTKRQMTNLRRRRYDLRALSAKKTSLRTKRKILQKGGFLTALVPPVLSVLGSLLMQNRCSQPRNWYWWTNLTGNTSDYRDLVLPSLKPATVFVCQTLRDGSLADDHKVRQYVGELHRYLNVNNREPSAERSCKASLVLT